MSHSWFCHDRLRSWSIIIHSHETPGRTRFPPTLDEPLSVTNSQTALLSLLLWCQSPKQLPAGLTSESLGVPGLLLLPDFVTEAEEHELLTAVQGRLWTTLAKRRVQHYGHIFDYTVRRWAWCASPPRIVGHTPKGLCSWAHHERCVFGLFRLFPRGLLSQSVVTEIWRTGLSRPPEGERLVGL